MQKRKCKINYFVSTPLVESGAGFTLIELIIVVAIIALLAAAVFVAVDPAKRIGDANNAQRWSDVTAIADAIITYTVDSGGILPSTVSTATDDKPVAILVAGSDARDGVHTCANVGDLTTTTDITLYKTLLVPTYIPTMATDPTLTASSTSGYFMVYDSTSGRIKIGACTTYNSASIYVQR